MVVVLHALVPCSPVLASLHLLGDPVLLIAMALKQIKGIDISANLGDAGRDVRDQREFGLRFHLNRRELLFERALAVDVL